MGFMKLTAIVLIVSFILSASPVCVPKTHAWMAIPAAILKQAMEELSATIQGIIRGVMKVASATTLQSLINSFLSGGEGGASFIDDWQDYLIKQPKEFAKVQINDFITQSLKGRNISSQYVSSALNGGGGNYLENLGSLAKSNTSEKNIPTPDYSDNPTDMFSAGNLKSAEQLFQGTNYFVAYNSVAKGVFEEIKKDEQLKALAEGIAGESFLGPKDESGKIKTPGITVKDMVSNAKDLPNKILAGATNVGEVVESLVASILTDAMEKCIGSLNHMSKSQSRAVDESLTWVRANWYLSNGPR